MHTVRPALLTSWLLATYVLSGCATMNEGECLTVDWRTVGYEDGVAGYAGDRIAQHRKACAKHGVAPDLGLYQAGRDEGLREFCQPENGFRVGARGGSYGGVCPAELSGEFVQAFESGRQLHALESRVSSTNSQIESKRRELHRVEDQAVKAAALIIANDSTTEQRAQALVDTKQLAERAGRLKAEVQQLEKDKVRYERDLEDYRNTVAFLPR